MPGVTVSFKPTKKQLDLTEKWLLEENNSGKGFYCNWRVIKSAHSQKRMAIIKQENQPVGFAIWQQERSTATLDILEIKPTHRNQGLCRIFIKELFRHFIERAIYVLDLQCSPAESEAVWRKLGFIDFPPTFYDVHPGNRSLYKILQPQTQSTETEEANEVIALWNDEPYLVKGRAPYKILKLTFKDGTRELIDPVIYPCHPDWQISWRINKEEIQTKKAKYFINGDYLFDRFIIITSLPDVHPFV